MLLTYQTVKKLCLVQHQRTEEVYKLADEEFSIRRLHDCDDRNI